jgi:hypothetical protein
VTLDLMLHASDRVSMIHGDRRLGQRTASVPAAAIEYYVYRFDVFICVTAPHRSEPLVVRAGPLPDGRRLDESHLVRCMIRLLTDVHGLPAGWDVIEHHRATYLAALELSPAVHSMKRSAPQTQHRLYKDSFCYGLDYLTELSSALIPSEIRGELEPYDQLCIVPHGPMHGLPFSVLDWADGVSLIERFALSVLPAAAILPQLQRRNRRRADAGTLPVSMAVIAAAAIEDTEDANFESESEMLQAIVRAHGVDLAAYAAATKADLREAAKHDIVHVACHGVFGSSDGGDIMDTAGLLLYSDGVAPSLFDRSPASASHLMSAREALGLGLTADLVTLRACSSGRSFVTGGDDLMGMLVECEQSEQPRNA